MKNEPEPQLPGSPPATVDYQAAPDAPVSLQSRNTGAEIRYLDAAAFRDDGYLQEANRGFFHPLGLALELELPAGEPPFGVALLRVWDYREDPEGIRFVGGGLAAKAARVALCADARRSARVAALGYWQQPAFIPDTPPQGWEDSVAELLNEAPASFPPGGPIQHFPRELDYVNAKLREKHEEAHAGSFLGLFLCACLRADGENYSLLRPTLAELMKKYPAAPAFLRAEQRDSPAGDGGA